MGLAGEGLVDKRVLVIKSHYPERYGKTKFGAERAILLVRSPLDCITSLFNMICTGSHDLSISDKTYAKFPNQWLEFVRQEITVWKDFHEFWLKAKIPVHIVRYEDIVQKPVLIMIELIKFILNIKSIDGTKIERYIQIACEQPSPQVYKPRKGIINGNRDKFRPKTLEFMANHAKDLLIKFGYANLFIPDETADAENTDFEGNVNNIT